jgi:hypothetical protein
MSLIGKRITWRIWKALLEGTLLSDPEHVGSNPGIPGINPISPYFPKRHGSWPNLARCPYFGFRSVLGRLAGVRFRDYLTVPDFRIREILTAPDDQVSAVMDVRAPPAPPY